MMVATEGAEREMEASPGRASEMGETRGDSRSIQQAWASDALDARLGVLKRARHIFADSTTDLCDAIPSELSRKRSRHPRRRDFAATRSLPIFGARGQEGPDT